MRKKNFWTKWTPLVVIVSFLSILFLMFLMFGLQSVPALIGKVLVGICAAVVLWMAVRHIRKKRPSTPRTGSGAPKKALWNWKEYAAGTAAVLVILLALLWIASMTISFVREVNAAKARRQPPVMSEPVQMAPTLIDFKRGEYNAVKKGVPYAYRRGVGIGVHYFPNPEDYDVRAHVEGPTASWDFWFDERGVLQTGNLRGDPKAGGGALFTVTFSKDATIYIY